MKTVLGGAPPSARNFIWGDGWEGVWIYGDDADRSTVSGNCIGADSSRVFVVGNTYSGIWISGGAQDNDIGSGNIIAYKQYARSRWRGPPPSPTLSHKTPSTVAG